MFLDAELMRARVKQAFEGAERGDRAQIAKDLGVGASTVGRWADGTLMPAKRHRAYLEQRFGLALGALSAPSLTQLDDDKAAALTAAIARIEQRLDALERQRREPPPAPDGRADP